MIRTNFYSVRLEYRLPKGTSFIRIYVKAYNEEFAMDIAFQQAAIQFAKWGYESVPKQNPIVEIYDITTFAEDYMSDREINKNHVREYLEHSFK